MPSFSTAFDAARESRGYLFSVVACAVLLATMAVIQGLRRTPSTEPWTLRVFASSRSGDLEVWPLGRDARLPESLFADEAIARARRQVVAAAGSSDLESPLALRSTLAVIEPEGRQPGEKALQLVYRGRSQHGGAFLQALAEQYVDRHVQRPRMVAAAQQQSAQSALESGRREARAASQKLEQMTREIEDLRLRIDDRTSQLDQVAREQQQSAAEARHAGSTSGTGRDLLAAQEQQLQRLRAFRTTLLKQYTERHPQVLELNQRIEEASAALERARQSAAAPQSALASRASGDEQKLTATRAEIEGELTRLRERLAALQATRDQQMASLADLEEQLDRREAEAKEGAEKLAQLEGIHLRTTDAERPPATAPRTNALGLLFSLVLGCLMGGVASVTAGPAHPRLRDRTQIESVLALPVIGLLPSRDDSSPAPEIFQPHAARTLRGTAEVTLGCFLVTTLAAISLADGFSSRLASQPLSAVADSVREVVQHLFA